MREHKKKTMKMIDVVDKAAVNEVIDKVFMRTEGERHFQIMNELQAEIEQLPTKKLIRSTQL